MSDIWMSVVAIVIIAYLAFISGCLLGREPMSELERNGYEVVKHEVRHGDFSTNWVEVVKKGDKRK